MGFNVFFMDYKLGLRNMEEKNHWNELTKLRKKYIISEISLMLILFLFFAFIAPEDWIRFMGCAVVICTLLPAVIWIIKDIRKRRMIEESYIPYSIAKTNMLIALLEDYGINLDKRDSVDKIDLLIQQAEENKIKDNPFIDVNKLLKLFGAIIIPVIAYIATKYAEGKPVEELIALVSFLVIAFVIVFLVIFLTRDDNISLDIYDELIYDLKQLKIFPYIDITTNDNQ